MDSLGKVTVYFCPIPTRKDSNAPLIKISKELTVLIYTVRLLLEATKRLMKHRGKISGQYATATKIKVQ